MIRADFDYRDSILRQFPQMFSVPTRYFAHMIVVADLGNPRTKLVTDVLGDIACLSGQVTGGSPARQQSAVRPVADRPATAGSGERVLVSRRGLELRRGLPFERWLGIGRQLSAVSTSAAWCLGDWLAFGERAYAGRYRQAVEQTSLDYQTLRNYAWVARQFVISRRRDMLSFGHHAEVAALAEAEQDFLARQGRRAPVAGQSGCAGRAAPA